MRSHFDAIKVMLAPMGRPVYTIDVTGSPKFTYLLLWGLPGLLEDDSLDGAQVTVRDLLRVTCVGATPEAAMEIQRISRGLLIDQRPIVEGRHVHELRFFDSEPIKPDQDVRLPETNRYPFFGVDVYRLVSEPA